MMLEPGRLACRRDEPLPVRGGPGLVAPKEGVERDGHPVRHDSHVQRHLRKRQSSTVAPRDSASAKTLSTPAMCSDRKQKLSWAATNCNARRRGSSRPSLLDPELIAATTVVLSHWNSTDSPRHVGPQTTAATSTG